MSPQDQLLRATSIFLLTESSVIPGSSAVSRISWSLSSTLTGGTQCDGMELPK